MLIIDIILLILLLGFFIRGWQSGLIRMLAGLIGIVAGIVVAGHFYPVVAEWFIKMPFLVDKQNLTNVLSMVIIFLAVNGIIGMGAYLVDRTFHIFSFIPFLKTINKISGALLGLIGGAFIFGWLITMLDKFPFADFINNYLINSEVVPYLLIVSNFIMPLWPTALEQIKGILETTDAKYKIQ